MLIFPNMRQFQDPLVLHIWLECIYSLPAGFNSVQLVPVTIQLNVLQVITYIHCRNAGEVLQHITQVSWKFETCNPSDYSILFKFQELVKAWK